MKNLRFVIFAFWIVLLLGCNPCKYVSKHPECFKVDTTIIDTVTVIKESVEFLVDTASLDLYLQCDSNYNVLVQEYSTISDEKEKIKIVYKYKSNRLQIKSFADSVKILNTLVEKYKNEKTFVLNPVNNQLKEDVSKYKNRLRNRKWLWWYFGSSIVLLIIFLYFKLTSKNA
jgi:hypothetical protein